MDRRGRSPDLPVCIMVGRSYGGAKKGYKNDLHKFGLSLYTVFNRSSYNFEKDSDFVAC